MRPAIVTELLCLLLVFGCQSEKVTPRVISASDGSQATNLQLASSKIAPERPVGEIESVALFTGPMPTVVAVSHEGRIFVNFPRWGDPTDITVAEIVNGQVMAYPSAEFNKLLPDKPADCLVSVQSVVIDDKNRLWVLDTGSINFQAIVPGGPKLICYDLATNREIKRIEFPNSALSTTYLNDVRFNLRMGREGYAFITDSSDKGPNAIIVVDLASGQSWRRLEGHPSTIADVKFVPNVEGEPLMLRPKGEPEKYLQIGSDGIAISPDGKILYYCPLASRRLYSVSTDALANRNLTADVVARTIRQLPQRDYASDGLACDRQGRLYLTDYEHNAIHRRNADGDEDQIIAQDPRMIWPDSISIGTDGCLYFTCNQLNRQPRFHVGKDLRRQPYVLLRTRLSDQQMVSR